MVWCDNMVILPHNGHIVVGNMVEDLRIMRS